MKPGDKLLCVLDPDPGEEHTLEEGASHVVVALLSDGRLTVRDDDGKEFGGVDAACFKEKA